MISCTPKPPERVSATSSGSPLSSGSKAFSPALKRATASSASISARSGRLRLSRHVVRLPRRLARSSSGTAGTEERLEAQRQVAELQRALRAREQKAGAQEAQVGLLQREIDHMWALQRRALDLGTHKGRQLHYVDSLRDHEAALRDYEAASHHSLTRVVTWRSSEECAALADDILGRWPELGNSPLGAQEQRCSVEPPAPTIGDAEQYLAARRVSRVVSQTEARPPP